MIDARARFPADAANGAASAPRTEEEAVAGTLTLTFGGRQYVLPVLKRAQSREWKRRTLERISKQDVPETDLEGNAIEPDAFLLRLLSVVDDTMFEALVDYDQSNVLGGSEWLDAHATDREVHDATEVVAAATFPFAGATPLRSAVTAFGDQLRYLVMEYLRRHLVRLQSGTPAPTDGTPTPSMPGSPTSSGSSTGPTGSTGKRGRRPTAST